MKTSMEDHPRTLRGGPLELKPTRQRYVKTGASQLLEKRKENVTAGEELQAQREVFEVKRNSLRLRRDEVLHKEKHLEASLINFDKFLQENDAKCSRSITKAEKERQAGLQKEAEAQRLSRRCRSLDGRRRSLQLAVERSALYGRFLEQVLKTATLEEVRALVGRFETLLVTRTQLSEREGQARTLLDGHRGSQQRELDRQNCLLMHHNNRLSQLQTELDLSRADRLGWESRWTHIQNTAAKETLLLGQIKTGTLNLFQLAGGVLGGDQGVEVDATETQLDRIQIFIQKQMDIMNEINPSDTLFG
ncbi:coiled-coil domain-containing protein 42 homolog isoform X1 [Gadus morhua]|uniref:coiled-coil domain-containing protein 42 homolog isoform X1 n=1 Tax=Gadus morhua TaxID=8049 RepID=UPI0011B5826A|nr:cilia- and flagella-associated protein 73 isoform X1 [Gadus morhua]